MRESSNKGYVPCTGILGNANPFETQQESGTKEIAVVRDPEKSGFFYQLVRQAGEHVNLNTKAIRDYEMREIAAALKETNCTAKYLQMVNCGITDNRLRILTNALRNNTTVEVLDVRNNAITSRGVERVVEALSVNETLREVYLDGSRFAHVHRRLSPFRNWLKRNQPKATLAAEITYAQEIYMQAQDPQGTYDDPAAIQSQLENTPLLERLDSSKGISVDWFLDVFCEIPFLQALMENECELWFLRKVGVNEILRRLGIRAGPMADHVEALAASSYGEGTKYPKPLTKDTATVFVSYTGRFLLRNFVELLDKNLRGEYMWMDVFCVDQFAWTGKKKSKEVNVFSDTLIGNLPEQIRGIGRVVLMLERWNDVPYTLQQAWVLWEIYNTVAVGSQFIILMTEAEKGKFLSCIDHGENNEIQEALGEIRSRMAQSEDTRATESILEKMEKEGFYNVDQTTIEQVRRWYQGAGMEHLQSLDMDSPERLRFLNNYALLLHKQGKLAQAEPLFQEALEARRRLLGNDHPRTLESINNYALLLDKQGKLTEAEPLYQEALEACRRLLGNDHPRTLYSIHNYTNLLYAQGKLTEAEPLCQEALEGERRLLGNDNTSTLGCITSYANLLRRQGKLTDAEPMYREALEGYRRLLGNDHADTLGSINNYANLLNDQGNLTEAEPLYQEVLKGKRRLLGNDHPDTLTSINNYANLLSDQGKLTEAEPLCQEALAAHRRLLGNDHPDTLSSINVYANLFCEQGKLAQAEPFYQEALEARRRLLGNDHTDTLISIYNYALLLKDQGKLTEAEPLFQETLEARRRMLGNDHRRTLDSIHNYAALLHEQGKLTEAEPLYQEALEACRRLLGNDHPDTLDSIFNYAKLLLAQGQSAEAEPLLKETIEALRAQLERNPRDVDTMQRLDLMLNLAGLEAEAERLSLRLVLTREAHPPRSYGRLDWVRLTGTSDDGMDVTVSQFYRPHPYGFFTFYNTIKVFDPNLPRESPVKRLFRLESSPGLDIEGILAGRRQGATETNSAPARRFQNYFLREYFNDGSGGGCTYESYGENRPTVQQLLNDVLSLLNKNRRPTVAMIPPGGRRRGNSGGSNPPTTVVDTSTTQLLLSQLDTAISNMVSNGGGATSMRVLQKYIRNLVDHPADPKFKKINTENATHRNTVEACPGATEILRLIGFEAQGKFLVLNTSNSTFWKQALRKIENYFCCEEVTC